MSLWLRMHKFKESRFANDASCSVCGQPMDTAQHRANGIPLRSGGIVVNVNAEDLVEKIRREMRR